MSLPRVSVWRFRLAGARGFPRREIISGVRSLSLGNRQRFLFLHCGTTGLV